MAPHCPRGRSGLPPGWSRICWQFTGPAWGSKVPEQLGKGKTKAEPALGWAKAEEMETGIAESEF